MEKDELLVMYGDDPEAMARRIAGEARLADLIGQRGKRIGLKPNLVAAKTADQGATTHPEIVRGLAGYLKEQGFTRLTIMEGSWVGDDTDKAFARCGYTALAAEEGLELVNLQKDRFEVRGCKGMDIAICAQALKVDFMINIPVLKGHCQTLLTCALKNNKGVIPDREKRRFHTLGLHKPIAHLNTAARNDFVLVDGICGDLEFEEGGNPVPAGRIFASRDPVLCDAWAASLLGYDAGAVPYIGLAEQLGVGSADVKQARIRELNRCSEGAAFPLPRGKERRFSRFIREDKACSACYAALVSALSRMDYACAEPVCIGQGFKGKTGALGVGRCTAGFAASSGGCPPTAAEVLGFLTGRGK
ncbi:MAG: DUF362 domain-containing protein [Spirochaetaceae bacterium]|jgi:uncharacterized protein (DUF362 family)|nr:DUF362 domain-containing protein [Spirochaetaceae bacterium]